MGNEVLIGVGLSFFFFSTSPFFLASEQKEVVFFLLSLVWRYFSLLAQHVELTRTCFLSFFSLVLFLLHPYPLPLPFFSSSSLGGFEDIWTHFYYFCLLVVVMAVRVGGSAPEKNE